MLHLILALDTYLIMHSKDVTIPNIINYNIH